MHHAYLLVGDSVAAEKFLHSFWEKEGVKLAGSPDYFPWTGELFGIDEARELTSRAAGKAFTERKVFFISPDRITIEAQNALLKTFEDPYEATHFFLVVREEELVLPTLRSRVHTLRVNGEEKTESDAAKFLSLNLKERLSFAKKFSDSDKNLSVLLDDILMLLRISGEDAEKIAHVYEARRYSDDRAASARLILEHLSLML